MGPRLPLLFLIHSEFFEPRRTLLLGRRVPFRGFGRLLVWAVIQGSAEAVFDRITIHHAVPGRTGARSSILLRCVLVMGSIQYSLQIHGF